MDSMYEKNVCMQECLAVSNSFANPWTVAHQGPLSMEFSRQEYSSRLLVPPPGDGCIAGIKHTSLASPALAGRFFTAVPPAKHEKKVDILFFRDKTLSFPSWTELPFFSVNCRSLFELLSFPIHILATCVFNMACESESVGCSVMSDTLSPQMDDSPLGFSVYGIFQARTLEWVAIPFSRESY